jgi:endoplasmic reticulum-Golgi intermediate compartment protein 3
MYFTADDEADESKAQVSREMRERLGIYQHPLDDYMARVRGFVTIRVYHRETDEACFFLSFFLFLSVI